MSDSTQAATPRVWIDDPDERPTATIRNVYDLRDAKLTLAQPLQGTLPRVIIDVAPGPLPDYFECGALRLMSSKLVELLKAETRPGDVEFIPVDVQQGRAQLSYAFGHVVKVVDCLDLERSRYTSLDGIVDSIDHLEIEASRTVGERIFRVGGTYEYLICVASALAERISASSSGSSFVSPSEWRW